MRYVNLKDTDLKLSALCLGADHFGEKLDEAQSFALLDEFVRRGGNFIDTANVYCRWVPGKNNCSEQLLGKWLKSRGAYGNVVVATKGAHYSLDSEEKLSRVTDADIRADLEESMDTLGMDVLDFYWLHRDDPSRPVEEIIDILETLRAEGKIRYYGLSNYRTDRLAQAKKYLEASGKKGPYAVSNQWSMASVNPGCNTNPDPTLVEFSEEEYAWHRETGVPVIPFSSTAKGFFEKLKKAGVEAKDGRIVTAGGLETISPALLSAYLNERNLRSYEKLLNLHRETGHSIQALSLAYMCSHPFQVIPASSVRNQEQLDGFLEAADIDWKSYD